MHTLHGPELTNLPQEEKDPRKKKATEWCRATGYKDPESRRDRQLPGCGHSSVGPEPEARCRRSKAQTRGKMQTSTLMNTAEVLRALAGTGPAEA